MNQEVDDQMSLVSQLYPVVYTQLVPQQGVLKPRRRRRKSKAMSSSAGENGIGGLMRKRKLSAEQVYLLEKNFGNEHKLESERKDRLASELGLDPRQVTVWFQNRRARWKNKKLEEEYSTLKKSHDSIVVEKSRMESEALKLKEKLLEVEKEIQRLSELAFGGASSDSTPSSSLSVEAAFLVEFGIEGGATTTTATAGTTNYADAFYMEDTNYYNIHGLEWVNPYMLIDQ